MDKNANQTKTNQQNKIKQTKKQQGKTLIICTQKRLRGGKVVCFAF